MKNYLQHMLSTIQDGKFDQNNCETPKADSIPLNVPMVKEGNVNKTQSGTYHHCVNKPILPLRSGQECTSLAMSLCWSSKISRAILDCGTLSPKCTLGHGFSAFPQKNETEKGRDFAFGEPAMHSSLSRIASNQINTDFNKDHKNVPLHFDPTSIYQVMRNTDDKMSCSVS